MIVNSIKLYLNYQNDNVKINDYDAIHYKSVVVTLDSLVKHVYNSLRGKIVAYNNTLFS